MNDGGRIIRPRTPALPSKPQVPRVAISLPERHCGEELSPEVRTPPRLAMNSKTRLIYA